MKVESSEALYFVFYVEQNRMIVNSKFWTKSWTGLVYIELVCQLIIVIAIEW